MNNEKNGLTAKIYANRSIILRNTISITLIFLIFVLEGCISFAEMRFLPERLLDLSVWAKIGFSVLLLVLMRLSMMIIFLDVARKNNQDLLFQRERNEKLMKLKESDFPYYIENVKNKQIKKEYFTKKIQKKLLKLERKAKEEDRALYFSEATLKKQIKANNRYCVKREVLELMLTDEYQEKNYTLLDVKDYPHIDSSVFDVPVSVRTENNYQLSSKTNKAIGLSLLSATAILILTRTLWNLTEIDPNTTTALSIAIGMITDAVFLLWQGYKGIMNSFSTIRDQEVLPYANRNRILKEYLYWKKPNEKENIDKILEVVDKSKENK